MKVHMKKKLLFLCTGNSCRSQMAEGLLRRIAGDKYEVFSAGVEPSKVHPISIIVMNEAGIDISSHHSDDVKDYLNAGIDIVISVCDHASQTCPVFPGDVQRVNWSVEDPYHGWAVDESKIPDYRRTRDELKERILDFLEQ